MNLDVTVEDFDHLSSICSVMERGAVTISNVIRERICGTHAGPPISPGLYGVLNSPGLLAGSPFTLDIGVSNFRFEALFVDLTLGVLGARPSSLYIQHLFLRSRIAYLHSKNIPIARHISRGCPSPLIRVQNMRFTPIFSLQSVLDILLKRTRSVDI